MSERLRELVASGESESLELKRSLADDRRIIETVAAMATRGGGTIIVGVSDDGAVVGANLGAGARDRLVQRLLTATDPRVYVELRDEELDGETLLVIRVPPGDGPHLAFGRAFHRVGPATVATTRDEYERRLLDRLRESGGFERRPVGSLDAIESAAVGAFAERAARRGLAVGQRPDDVLGRLHLLDDEQRVLVGGMLTFARWPQGPLPQAVIRARAERGASKDSASIEGRLDEQIDGATAFVARNLRVRADRSGLVRVDVPELPLDAVRETVANAVAHRDYRSTAPIQLRLDDRSLTVWNPGHLPEPLTPAMLRAEHPSVPPNPLLARVLFLAGYIEEWGTGTNRIVGSMAESGNPEPLFEEVAGGVQVTLPLPGALPAGLAPRTATFMAEVAAGAQFTTAEYAERAGVAHRTALGDLRQLEDYGVIRRLGRGKASRWERL